MRCPNLLFSIGHSNHPEEDFMTLLQRHEIEVLADVRSQPYCRYATHFSADPIKALLSRHGVRYAFFGQRLGGRPQGSEYYDPEGHVRYSVLARSEPFVAGIQRLLDVVSRSRVAVMCSEENPEICHRHLLIGRVLHRRGVDMLHIRRDGSLQTYAQIEAARGGDQGLLFAELEADTWKSLQSVLPKLQPPNSLEN